MQVTHSHLTFMKTLAYKSIDLEARSRRNNLIFRGFVENVGENCLNLLQDFLRNRLGIYTENIYIARVHRLCKRNPRRHHQMRPVIANFRDFSDIELIMANERQLKSTPFSIDYHYPLEIQEARSRLWPRYKELKRTMPRSKVQIV